jgi:hypothetical protein
LHGLVKTKVRNSLKVVTLDMIMRMKMLLGNYQDFDLGSAVEAYLHRSELRFQRLGRLHLSVSAVQVPYDSDGYEHDDDDVLDLAGIDEEGYQGSESTISAFYGSSFSDQEEDDDESVVGGDAEVAELSLADLGY